MKKINYLYYTIYRFSSTALLTGLQTVILPLAVSEVVAYELRGVYLSILSGLSVLIGLPFYLLAGYWGDHFIFPRIRRRFFIAMGSGLIVFCSFFVFAIHTFSALVVFSIFIFCGICMSESSHSALIPDNFQDVELATAIRWLSGSMFFGMLFGTGIAGLLSTPRFLSGIDVVFGSSFSIARYNHLGFLVLISITGICALINCAGIVEKIEDKPCPKSSVRFLTTLFDSSNLKSKRFLYFLLLRSFVSSVVITLSSLYIYFSRDVMLASDPALATTVGMILYILSAVAGLKCHALLSKTNELVQTQVAILTMIPGLFLIALSYFYFYLFFCGIALLGIGYGSFFSSSLHYSIKNIPDEKFKGLYMALASSASFLGYILGMMTSGVWFYLFSEMSIAVRYLMIFGFFSLFLMISLAIANFGKKYWS